MILFRPLFRTERFSEVDSTNRVARTRAGEGAPIFSAFVAESQTAGRGRETRRWDSPRGGLYCSALVPSGARTTDWSLLAPIAVVETLSAFLPPDRPAQIKWPNDILVGGKKICGILCEALVRGEESLCIVGIGVNLRTRAVERELAANPFPPTSVESATGRPVEFDDFLTLLLLNLEARWRAYRQGEADLKREWEARAAHRMAQLRVRAADRDFEGTFLGIEEDGRLILATGPGECRRFASGEVQCYWP